MSTFAWVVLGIGIATGVLLLGVGALMLYDIGYRKWVMPQQCGRYEREQ